MMTDDDNEDEPYIRFNTPERIVPRSIIIPRISIIPTTLTPTRSPIAITPTKTTESTKIPTKIVWTEPLPRILIPTLTSAIIIQPPLISEFPTVNNLEIDTNSTYQIYDISQLETLFTPAVIGYLVSEEPGRSCSISPYDNTQLEIGAINRDLFHIFNARIQSIINDPAEFKKEIYLKGQHKIHVHIDASNVIGHRKIDTYKLINLIGKLRQIENGVITASCPDRQNTYWNSWERVNFTIDVHHRVNIGGRNVEDAVDQAIHNAIQADIIKEFSDRRTLVLLTGDGNDNRGRTNFPSVVDTALRRGWSVELWSWGGSLNRTYKRFSHAYPGYFKYFLLDPFAEILQCRSPVAISDNSAAIDSYLSPSRCYGDIKFESLQQSFHNLFPALDTTATTTPTNISMEESHISTFTTNKDSTTNTNTVGNTDESSFLAELGELIQCCICIEIMTDPVTTSAGHSYCRLCIEKWIRLKGTEPVTHATARLRDLTPNILARKMITKFYSRIQKNS